MRASRHCAMPTAFRSTTISAAIVSQRLLAAFDAAAPAVVLFETFPFGRRSLRFELVPLLERIAATRPRPRVLASIRDILQLQEKAGRDAEAWDWAQRWFDEVLVHGDPSFVRLEETFPLAADGRVPIVYTGYVTSPGEPLPRAPLAEQREIVVSAGGGATGSHVLHAAIAARPLSAHRDLVWRILVGPGIADDEFRALRRQGGRRASSSSATATTFLHCWRARACPYRRPDTTR